MQPPRTHAVFPVAGGGDTQSCVGRVRKKLAGKRVRELRGSLSQEAFAAAIGVHRNQVARWESGADDPSYENAQKLHRYETERAQRRGVLLPSTVESAGGNVDLEQALISHFRILPVERRAELLLQIQKEADAHRSQMTAAPTKG